MKTLLILVGILSSTLSFAQEFVLNTPDVSKLKEQSKQKTFKGNLLHLFLTQQYQGVDQIPQDPSVFNQISFGDDIVYMQVDSSQEGILERISIPTCERMSVIKWVERINKFYGDDDYNVWNFDQTSYAPVDMYGGGIFKITWKRDRVYIDKISRGC